MTTVSLLQNSLKVMNLSDIPDYFQSPYFNKLSTRTVFRAIVSRYLWEAVLSSMPRDIEHFRATVRHMQDL
ncbi:predicted protein [Sclerotinia sclerotiorum 1980 UF-70]|uniref:Uncharacterized protein n=1 Tax=Sclerotinia sclerotiorum (strain ATCC 18683 / 1980 / Ss-1) TaxID=665079 RepID=A7ES16_SCLS1|nr:predicted protein [Sclerotinia sclerotiorum 1980 UF-70]EDN92258.1 predicted protein [Sclerotinia sclerotiorum 1980 UF-70]